MKPKSMLQIFLSLMGTSLLAFTSASADTYYWDSNGDGTPGFGSAAGTWSSTGIGNLWSTDPGGNAGAVADYATTIDDDLFFGTGSTSDVPPLYPFTGAITISGTVNAKSIYCSSNHPNFIAGTSPALNFADEGRFEHATEGTITLPSMTLTGATTSMTWKAGFIDNLGIQNLTNNAAKNIIEGTGGFIVVSGGADLGPAGTPFVFNGGGLRMLPGFYTSMSAFDADHPLTINPNVDIGFDPRGFIFTVDIPLNLGTGGMYIGGTGTSAVVLTNPETYTGGTYLVAGYLQVSDNAQLGDITSPLNFGSGGLEGGNGILRITGTSMSDLGLRPLTVTDGRAVAFDIEDAANTFTLDKILPTNMPTGANLAFQKIGAGTLILTEENEYTGKTEVLAGTLLINGDQSAAIGLVDVRTGSVLGGTGTIGGNVTIENTSGLTFDLSTGPGSHDKLDVLGTLTFESASVLNITSSDEAAIGTYTLLTAGSPPTGSVPATVNLPSGWTADAPEIVGNDLVINITSIGGSPFNTWATTEGNAPTGNPDDDFDGDGVSNAIEFILGGDKDTNDLDKLPTVEEDGTNMTFTFVRNQNSIDASVSVEIEVGSDLATWPDTYTVGTDTAASDPGITVVKDDPASGTDTITLTVTKAPDTKKFARLKVEIAP